MQVAGRPMRAEHDLSNPGQLALDPVPRRDVQVGISSAQEFAGEDLARKARVRAMQAEQRAVTAAQLEEKAGIARDDAAYEAAYAELARRQHATRVEVEDANAASRFQQSREDMLINQELSRMRVGREAEDRQAADERGQRHSEYIRSHPLYTESRTSGYDRHGNINRTEWKGMQPDELSRIRATQSQHRLTNVERARQAAEDEASYAAQQAAIKQLRDDAYEQKMQNNFNTDYATFNYLKAQDQIHIERAQEEKAYRSQPAQDYWPYGKTDR